ncbi:Uncharacterised protein [Bordetella pertussis]|nr:Uncharacterised protein [Bordetella pertussis]
MHQLQLAFQRQGPVAHVWAQRPFGRNAGNSV